MKLATLCRWTARLAATAITALFITFVAGEGRPDLRELSDQELLGFVAVFLMVLGTLAGWVRDLPGALLILAGYGAFAAIQNGWPPLAFLPWLVAGVLLLLSRVLRLPARRARTSSGSARPTAVPPGS